MPKLPTPEIIEVTIDSDEGNEDRIRVFFSLLRKAMTRRCVSELKQSRNTADISQQ